MREKTCVNGFSRVPNFGVILASDPMRTITAAVVQAGPVPFDTCRSLEKALEFIEVAATRSAELIVLPEAFLSGYPKGADFGARIGMRSPEGRTLFRRYYESAIDVPGAETERLGAACRDRVVNLVIGVIERGGGTLYCTALFFDSDGLLRGKHRKVMPTAMERLIWGFGDGSTLQVHNLPVGKVGAAICWENYMPLLRAHLYQQGIQLYCAPTLDDRDSWIPTMRHIAYEGRCFVLSACQYIRLDPETVIRGGSVIVNPFGEILAGPNYAGECVLTAELDLGKIVEGKFDLDVAGHYARPDIFKLTVCE